MTGSDLLIVGAGPVGLTLALSRPDQHVAWRGDRLPADPLLLTDHVRGEPRRFERSGVRFTQSGRIKTNHRELRF